MKFLLLLATLVAATVAAPSDGSAFIVGGVNALAGEFPFIVSLQYVVLGRSQHACGGSIIAPLWVLTAAHCLTELPSIGRLEVLAGKHNLAVFEDTQVRLGIDRSRTVIHPDWVAGGQVGPDDIAIIRMATAFVYTARIQPVRLPQAAAVPTGSSRLSGWGATASGTFPTMPNILQKAVLPVLSFAECDAALGSDNPLDVTNVCTGPLTGGVSACSGDSGGPLVQGSGGNEIIIGVVSWGVTPCGTAGFPSVFKKVSAYIPWITANTGISP
ncbi:unnamed protein product [Diamesa serratosioi]